MNFKSMDDIIDYALEKEKEAVAFYAELSQSETFSGAKEALAGFSREEEKHVKLLENFKADKTKIQSYTFKWVPDMKRSDYMVDITYEKGMPFNDTLRLAMKREENALKLYNELQEKSDDPDMVKLFKILSQEEAKHKNILETMYDDYMAEQGD